MGLFIRYFGIEWKQSCKVWLKTLTAGLTVAALLIAAAVGVTAAMKHLSAFETVRVGMVIPEEAADEDTMFAVSFLTAMDSVKSVGSFTYYGSEEEALAALKEGKVQTVIALPPYFYESVDSGENIPATLYVSKNADLNVKIFAELLKSGVWMLQIAEAGAYAMLDVAEADRPTETGWSEAGNVVAYIYLTEAITRSRVFDRQLLSAIGSVNYAQFYFLVALLVILLLQGWNFAHLYQKKNRVLVQKLKAEGLGMAGQTIVQLTVMTLLLWVQAMLLYYGAYGITRAVRISLLISDGIVVGGLFILAFSMACFFHLVYAIAGGDISGCVLLFAVNLFMILVSGIWIPGDYMPEVLQRISGFMPLKWWETFTMQIFYGEWTWEYALGLCAVSAVAAVVGGGVRCKNT